MIVEDCTGVTVSTLGICVATVGVLIGAVFAISVLLFSLYMALSASRAAMDLLFFLLYDLFVL